MIFDALQTANLLPYVPLAQAIADVLLDEGVDVPPRLVQRLPSGGSLFVMPAADRRVAICKLITFLADNPASGLPAIQGDVVVIDPQTGRRLGVLDGPTVTARRTAAVSLLAAQRLACRPEGPLLLVGAGVQGKAHLEAFAAGLGVKQVAIASRSRSSADALVAYARTLGMEAARCDDVDAVVAQFSLVVTCTSAKEIAVRAAPGDDAFVCAVGAFTPQMVEWSPKICQHFAANGRVVVDTRDADHEAGDLLQAGLDVSVFPTLADVVRGQVTLQAHKNQGVFFKSCGWAGWDLAAARCALRLGVTTLIGV